MMSQNTPPELDSLRAQWDDWSFLANLADETALGARQQLTLSLAVAILAAPLWDEAAGGPLRIGQMYHAGGGWSNVRAARANAAGEPGSPEWRAALGDHERVTLTGDGKAANREAWCRCAEYPAMTWQDVPAEEWVRYEYWTARGCEAHGFVHSVCRKLLQTG